jgi:hypothetical protein
MNTMKTLKLACLTALAALAAAPAFAQGYNLARQSAEAGESYDSRYVASASSVPDSGANMSALRLYYTGTSTEAVVTINSTGITFYAPNNVADPLLGAAALTFTTYPTIGALCDKVNTTGGVYQCRMEDARRSDSTALLAGVTATTGVNNLKANGGYTVGFTNGANSTVVVSSFVSLGINPPADLRVILKKCTFYGAGTSYTQFSVSGVKFATENAPDGVIRNDSTFVWVSSQTANSATTISFDDSGYGGITFAKSNQGIPGPSSGLPAPQSTIQTTPPNTLGRVVIRVAADVTGVAQGVSDYLYCQWVYR